MSRSRRQPVKKVGNSGMKKVSHRKFRKQVKQKIHENRLEELPEDQKEIVNQYDIVDWKFRATEEDDYYEKFKRK
jgi:hypothetical protein